MKKKDLLIKARERLVFILPQRGMCFVTDSRKLNLLGVIVMWNIARDNIWPFLQHPEGHSQRNQSASSHAPQR
jgi:hypothetical protein